MSVFNVQMPAPGPPEPTWTPPPIAQAPAVNVEGDPVERAFAAEEYATRAHQKWLQDVASVKSKLSPESFTTAVRSFESTAAARAVSETRAEVDRYAEAAQARYDDILAGLHPGADTADQLAAQRVWDRAKGVLDTQPTDKVASSARKQIAAASRSDLAVIAEELPAYLESRQVITDWIPDEIATAVPELAEARDQIRLLEKQRAVIQHNAAKLAREFESGHRSGVNLVDPRGLNARKHQ